MSKATQEKREWVGSYRDIQTGDGYLRIVAPDGMVWESAGTINDLPTKDQPTCQQQEELLIAINAIPKMEELIEAAAACIDLAKTGADSATLTAGEAAIANGDVIRLRNAVLQAQTALKKKA